jgi:hypothetical protein
MRVRNRRIPGVSIPATQKCLISYQIQGTPYTEKYTRPQLPNAGNLKTSPSAPATNILIDVERD